MEGTTEELTRLFREMDEDSQDILLAEARRILEEQESQAVADNK